MTTQTLNAVALDVVGQYQVIGKNLVHAYRVGTERAALRINDGYGNVVKSSQIPMVGDSIRNSMVEAHRQFLGFIVDGVARISEQADVAIDRAAESTSEGIKRLGAFGDRVKTVVGAPAVDTLTTLNMPAAQLSLQIVGTVAEGTKRLAERVAGVPVPTETDVKAAAKRTTAKA